MMHNTGITAATAENAALSIDGSQPVWMTLNEARERAFTGEIVFESDPEVHAYLDNGIVYYAESISDASLGRRLLDAGVIDVAQLERGTVRVGDIEHLGRLFDRDPSIDRDAVVVVAEASTEELIADLANRAITTARVTAYRHHPSGVHRWFVAPLDPATLTRPISAVSQLDSAVVDDLPGLPFADVDDLTIEWDDDLDQGTDHAARIEEFDLSLLDVLSEPETEEPQELDADVVELSLDLAEFTDDLDETDAGDEIAVDEIAVDEIAVDEIAVDEIAVDAAELAIAEAEAETEAAVETEPVVENETGSAADAEQATDLADFEFAVVWPDGSEELATDGTDYVDGSLVESAPTDVDSSDETVDAIVDVVVDQGVDVGVDEGEASSSFSQTDDGDLHFEMPPLTLSDEPELADDVPDDVAEAVRRAIAAIETASAAAPDVTTELPEIAEIAVIEEPDMLEIPAATVSEAPAPDAPAAGLGGFAPPTMAMRAEVLYGQMADDEVGAPVVAESSPADGVASVVFVDEPVEDGSGGGNERSSALSRLIGSLRRKDH